MRAKGTWGIVLATCVGLAGCAPGNTGTVCVDAEGLSIDLPWSRDCSGVQDELEPACAAYASAAVPALEALAGEIWAGSRDALGNARWVCWYDQEPDPIAKVVRVSLALGMRSVADWLAVADASAHDAVHATILLTLARHDDAAAIERLLARFSGDGRSLHESVVVNLSFVHTPLAMETVLAAVDVIGYPEDRLWGAPFSHDLTAWRSALRWKYAARVTPTYWLFGVGAPSHSSLLSRIREVDALKTDLGEAERAVVYARQSPTTGP